MKPGVSVVEYLIQNPGYLPLIFVLYVVGLCACAMSPFAH